MKIEKITVYCLKIPFSIKVKHHLQTRNETESIVLGVHGPDRTVGFGEGTPREYVTGETLDSCLTAAATLSQQVVGQEFESLGGLLSMLKKLGKADVSMNNPAAFCAVETALLDLWTRSTHQTLYAAFTNRHEAKTLFYSGVIPFMKQKETLLEYIALVKRLNLAALKIKVVDSESGIAQLKLIRSKLGQAIDIRVDANAAFSTPQAISFIKHARPIKLSAIEQPTAKEDLTGLKTVSGYSDIPVIADESIYTPKGAFYLIENNICHGLNIRLSSCGGFLKAYHTYEAAMSKQMMVVLGAHVGETAILSFAGRHLAMMCPKTTYLEGSFSKYVLKEDLVSGDISFGVGGAVPVPSTAGLGIEIDTLAIEKWSFPYAVVHL